MKLQYLADSRDAFKWDLLHWLCTRSTLPFSRLVFVPLLTRDDKSGEGQTPHRWFPCRPEIRRFVESVGAQPRSLSRVKALGTVEPARAFEVVIEPGEHYLGSGREREAYWKGWSPGRYDHSLVFFDPDIGFEIPSDTGPSWVMHREIESTLAVLPESSAVVVYQHRARMLAWARVFEGLRSKLTYAPFIVAVYEPNLAFVMLTNSSRTFRRLIEIAKIYCARQCTVSVTVLSDDAALHGDLIGGVSR